MIRIKIKRLEDGIQLPEYKTEHSSGMDIYSSRNMTVKSGGIVVVPTGIAMEIPPGYEVQIRPRSGLAINHGIGILNSPGTIDADYRGEIRIIIFNFSSRDYKIRRGERIAQMVLSKVYRAEFIETEKLNETERGEGGFGHTGY